MMQPFRVTARFLLNQDRQVSAGSAAAPFSSFSNKERLSFQCTSYCHLFHNRYSPPVQRSGPCIMYAGMRRSLKYYRISFIFVFCIFLANLNLLCIEREFGKQNFFVFSLIGYTSINCILLML